MGKAADMIAINHNTPRMTPLIDSGPLMNLYYNLVHAVQGQDVDMTMVAGKVLVENGQLVEHDLQRLINQVNTAAPALFARRKAWLESSNGATKRALTS